MVDNTFAIHVGGCGWMQEKKRQDTMRRDLWVQCYWGEFFEIKREKKKKKKK